jgi:hypothetical protein
MREIRRILCPVDLSDVSRHAVNHAVVIALVQRRGDGVARVQPDRHSDD